MSDAPVPAVRAPRGEGGAWMRAALAVLAVAVAALAWGWWSERAALAAVRAEVAQRHCATRRASRRRRAPSRARRRTRCATRTRRSARWRPRQLESQSQQLALESLYQELSRSRDDWVLAEVEQTLTIAARELQLAGNVRAALAALQAADARLARSDRPQFLGLRKVIARDIERLKAAPDLDIAGMTVRIDQVIAAVDQLPLLVDGRPGAAAPKPEAGAPEAGWWDRSWRKVWDELKGLVRVQRLDAADASLLAPESRYFLRENLKLRLLHARLALLQRDEQAFRSDVKAAQGWLTRYFDTRQKAVAGAVQTLGQLNAVAVTVELPTIADSLNAVRTYKAPRERGGK
ncbi:MAG: uroporphyrinogen-III C-methyltransferase [Burkholderiales bacterium]